MTKFKGLDRCVQSEQTQSGLQGLWALGLHELLCRVQSAWRLGGSGQCSQQQRPNPILCLLPLNRSSSFPVLRVTSGHNLVCAGLPGLTSQEAKGPALKNNQTLPGGGVLRSSRLGTSLLTLHPS